jgi:hypothetical protein
MEVQHPSHLSKVDWSKRDTEGVVDELVVLVEVVGSRPHYLVRVHQLERLLDALQHLVIADLMRLPFLQPAEGEALVAEYFPRCASVIVLVVLALLTPAVVVLPAE